MCVRAAALGVPAWFLSRYTCRCRVFRCLVQRQVGFLAARTPGSAKETRLRASGDRFADIREELAKFDFFLQILNFLQIFGGLVLGSIKTKRGGEFRCVD